MATLPKANLESPEQRLSLNEAAAELYKIVEGHFDTLGLTEGEKDERYGLLRERLDASDAAPAKA